jgi:membrane-bound lytic murein transglycosylase D
VTSARQPCAVPVVGVLLLLAAGCATTDGGSGPVAAGWSRFSDWTAQAAGQVARLVQDDDYRGQVMASVRSWFGDVGAGLNARSIEQIAAYADEARQLAAWAEQYEALSPYGAWLAARIDYYEAAREAVERIPESARPPAAPAPPPLVLPPPPPTRPTGTITVRAARPALPPPRPRHAPPRVSVPPPTVERQRIEAATQSDYWRRKVATHPLPPQAAGLVPRLQAIFREERVPEPLVWMAEVESRFDPAARSPAGAAGLFQLMPSTARALGLSTADPDQRLEPEANARAAARYLRRLHERFGTWPVALAAYNCGQGRVAGELKRAGAGTYEGIAARLPLETRMYVPRVQETIRLRTGKAL